ncbi:glycosyltransferase, partial [Vibrio sp. 10N.261.45.A7]
EDMTTFYGALDTFCLPSRHEGLPLSTLEAQACNIPTVAMDVGAVDETLCPVSGTLVKKGSITGLANALLENQNERFLSPRRYVLENFDIIKMVSSYNDISEGAYA